MNKKMLQEITKLTQECLTRFWQLDPEFVISYFDRDILWIGSAQSQYTEGYEETARDFRDIMKELKPCHLLQQEFSIVQNVGNTCTIAGRYLTTVDDEVGFFLQVQQRCTFVWEITEGGPRIRHCHISNPMGELHLAGEEKFPNILGQMSKKYWTYRFRAAQSKRRILVTDRHEVVHFLLPSEVVYVTAKGRNSIIHTTSDREIQARMSITGFLAAAGEGFTAVHRSYALNSAYISRIQKYEIIMADGSRVPVPERRYKEIRETLAGIYHIPAD